MNNISFIPIDEVSPTRFEQTSEFLLAKTEIELHGINEVVIQKYNRTIVDFFDYIILIGENQEQYEHCKKLLDKRDDYLDWLKKNRATAEAINEAVNKLK